MLSSSPTIFKNKIYNISSTSTGAPTVSGILQGSVGTAGTSNIYNNYVGDITAPNATTSSATTPSVRGINVTTTVANSTINISFNTVYLNASSTGTSFGTAGLFVTTSTTATTANLTLSNNIIVNLSTPSGIGNTVAYQRSSASLLNYNDNSNRNLLYRGTPGPQNLIYFDGTNSEQLLSGFKALVTPKEAQSIAENPPFLSTTGSNANFLHVNPAVGTQIESGAANIAGITDDYDGNIRQGNAGYTGAGSAPDIGADEGDFTFADLSGPSINYALINSTICLANPSLSAAITDVSSVNTTAGSKPRLWFKKSTENNILPATNTSVDNGWKWVEATNSSSPFNFVLDYSLLNSAAVNGDFIDYFIVAEDLSSTPNVGVNLATFSNGATSVQLAANVFPVSNTNSYSLIALPASVLANASQNSLCFSGNTTLSLSITNLNAEYQWQSSPAGANTWTPISGATNTNYSANGVNSSTDYRCIISCASVPVATISPTATASVVVNEPQILTTTPGAECASSSVSVQLEATSNAGSSLNWYASATGGAPLGTGTTFNTPAISTTTTYYVAANVGGSSGSVGPVNPTIGTTSASNIAIGTQRMFFDVLSNATILSVDIFPTAAIGSSGSITIRNNTQTVIADIPYTTTVTGGALQTVPLNVFLPAGTGYEMGQGTAINLSRNTTGAVYPFTSSAINITGNTFNVVYYYFYYNWQFSTGCESTRVPVLATVNNNATSTDIVTECGSYTWIDGNTYTSSNNTATFSYTGAAANGCDSIVTLDLTINNPSTGTDIITECGSYTWIDGVNYTSSNNTATFNIVGGAANGCDSIVTLDLTINNPTTGTDIISECGSYTWIDGINYTSSNNTATFNILGGAANGCDSLVTLDLTILNPTSGTDMIAECVSYTWIDGNTYTSSNNTATFNIIGGAANGCDSLVTLNLTILNPTTGTDMITECGSYTWIDGNTYTSSNNTATFNIIGGAANGCDSLVTLNLTINAVSDVTTSTAGVTITANNASATYQWLDCNNNFAIIANETAASFQPTANGSYAVQLTENGCVDTSACVTIATISIVENGFGNILLVYPNPTEGKFTVDLGSSLDNVEIQILDITGKIIQSAQYQ
ncbi:MAG: T9SS type A sorting domain-containing protein, partial [Bacteroidota bacterium]